MTKAEFLEKVGQRWDEFQDLHRFDNLYDFEKEYAKLAMDLNREMLEAILGQVPRDHRKKNK